jgi:hypothetical protein
METIRVTIKTVLIPSTVYTTYLDTESPEIKVGQNYFCPTKISLLCCIHKLSQDDFYHENKITVVLRIPDKVQNTCRPT